MPKIQYITKNIGAAKLAVIKQANAIIDAYEAQGFDLTLRQLYYQFVARDLIANQQSEYKKLGDIINDGRLLGLIDWDRIVDRTRNLQKRSTWQTPAEIVKSAAHSFHVNYWEGQAYWPEVWIEKDALIGVIEGVCEELDVPYFSCRGYTSQSEMWGAAQRLTSYVNHDQIPIIFHLGDHDPSGKDMTRDIIDRLQLFVGTEIDVKRLALNMDQVEQYNPPPNPCKVTDTRATAYIREFGGESWELDALEPAVLAALIRNNVEALIDFDVWQERVDTEESGKSLLTSTASRWSDVAEFLGE